MDFAGIAIGLVRERTLAVARRKETLTVCAMVDRLPSLRWVEWRQEDGSVAHVLLSGGKGLGGRHVASFRVDEPRFDNGALFL